MSIVSSTYSRGYYRALKEDCATEAVMTANDYKEKIKKNDFANMGDFWGQIAERLAKNGGYPSISRAFKIAFFVAPSLHPGYINRIYSVVHSQLQRLSNEEITALISDCRFVKQDIEFFRWAFIVEMVRRKVPGFFSKVWLLASQDQSKCHRKGDFYANVAIERAKNHDATSLEDAIGLAKCIKDSDCRKKAFEGIILEKFRMSNTHSPNDPLIVSSISEAADWLILLSQVPKCEELLPVILAERAVRRDSNAVEIAVKKASKIKHNYRRDDAYRKIAVEYATQPGGDASLRAWEIVQLREDDTQHIHILRTLMTIYMQKKDRQSFNLARQIPEQIEGKEYQDWLRSDFIKMLAGRATSSACAGTLIKLTRKLPRGHNFLETLKEVATHIARNCDDETGQILDKISRVLKVYEEKSYLTKIASAVIVELSKKKSVPIATVLTLAKSNFRGFELDEILQVIAPQSAIRSPLEDESLKIAASIGTERIKVEAYCNIALAQLNVDSPDAPARAFKTAQQITECIPRAFALLMIEMKCDKMMKR